MGEADDLGPPAVGGDIMACVTCGRPLPPARDAASPYDLLACPAHRPRHARPPSPRPMPIRVALHHVTCYRYDRPVHLGPQLIRLRPAPHGRTPVTAYSLRVAPADHFLNWQQDPHANFLARAVFPRPTTQLRVEVDLVAELTVINPFDFFLEPSADQFPFTYEPWLRRDLAACLETIDAGPAFEQYLAGIDRTSRPTVQFLVDLNAQLQRHVRYLIRLEPGVQTPEETLTQQSGSCRDSAWLLVQLLRRLGVAARFVSGYLIQLKPDVKSLDGPSGAERDFTDLHAWCEAYLPGAGWVGLDPTSGLFEGHIPLAATPEPRSAAPIDGALEECEVQFHHEMSVARLHEEPRVTLPYTEDQWREIDALGHAIDQRLVHDDARLTVGGEPTFVSIDDMDGPEWNTTAVGPQKRKLAERLIHRLRDSFTIPADAARSDGEPDAKSDGKSAGKSGALLHYGQGKWYPGEQLPRWALSCYWRVDGKPIWNDATLIADADRDYGFDHEHARTFLAALTRRLKLAPRYVMPAFEDPIHFLRREGQLPVNVTPFDSRIDDAEERDRLRRVFTRGLSAPTGYVLPLQRGRGPAPGVPGPWMWQSGLWLLRSRTAASTATGDDAVAPPRRHVVLSPGDSPIGLRLPLPSLPWVEPSAQPTVHPRDPMAARGPLPVPVRWQPQVPEPAEIAREFAEELPDESRAVDPGQSAEWVIRTALCVEPRGGRLHVFMPPLATIEDYLELIAAIEDTAAALQWPVVIEGETPPHDHRLRHFKVTPDPGVIEVNTPPAASWGELVHLTTTLHEDARQCRLGTEKFMLDGRHSGTGGGNHVVFGGPTPADSPLLRRPDLLRSLVGYWLNHPSLSYLFSGLFVGPTSQAPRVDEGRADAVYELEIACNELDRQQHRLGQCPPWTVDRLFRHLLADLTGNTHRAEFCIDKLYSPDTATGRLGLLEFRGFEMPPHPRMALTQQLLLRALVAWFWRIPYRQPLTRWGTTLHDRFLLPHFVWQDFTAVIADLNRDGLALRAEWFAPHFEFRFPVFGHVQHEGVSVELRAAIEPWLVLGEEPGGGGAVRYVDSSVERLQVTVSGLVGERYVVTCNGRRLPLQPTGVTGKGVAGVRYRAWQPPSCLHPTIGVHSPLVFDVVDTWNHRSIGGCTYHVAHPAGRNYTTFPVNAFEAEARRTARFFAHGHTPAGLPLPPAECNPEFTCTLDLRRPS